MARKVSTVLTLKDQMSGKLKGIQKQVALTAGKVKKIGGNVTRTGQTLTRNLTVPIVGLAAAGVKNFGEVDGQLRLIEQTMGKTKYATSDLGKNIEKAASNSVFSMKEATDAALNYARAGYDAKQASDMLSPAMNLAAGTSTDLSTVTEGLGSTLKAFGADSRDATGYADIFARAQSMANTTVTDLFDSMKSGGSAFKTVGWNVRDLSIATGILGDNLVSGSEAGNAFKSGLANLAKDGGPAAKVMKDLKIELFDGNGKMKSFAETQRILHDRFAGLTDQQKMNAAATLFGKTQMNKWLTLIEKSPAEIAKMSDALGNTEVTAQGMSDALMDGVGGSIERLKSTFDVFTYNIGEAAAGPVKTLFDAVTKLMEKFNNMSDAQQKAVVKIGLMAAAVGPALVIFGKMTTGVGNLMFKISRLAGFLSKFPGIMALITSPAGVAIGIVAALAAAFAVAGVAIYKNWDKVKKHLSKSFEKISGDMQVIAEVIKKAFDKIGQSKTLNSFLDGVANAFIWLIDHIPTVTHAIATMLQSEGFKTFVTTVSTILGTVVNVIMTTITQIRAYVAPILQAIGPKVLAIGQTVASGISQIVTLISPLIQNLITIIGGIWRFLQPHVAWFASTMQPIITSTLTSILSSVQGVISGIMGILQGLITVAQGVTDFLIGVFTGDWKRAWTGIKTIVKGAVTAIKSLFKAGVSALKGIAAAALGSVKATFVSGMAAIRGAVSGAVAGIKGLFSSIGGAITSSISGPIDWAKSKIESFMSTIESLKQKAASIGSGSGKSTKVKKKAAGTSYYTGGTTWVGEHGPELMTLPKGTKITPHTHSENTARKQSPTVNVTVQVMGNIIGNAEYATYLGNQISGQLLAAMAN